MDETTERPGRSGGSARLPLALAGILLLVALGLAALVAVGLTREEASGPAMSGEAVETVERAPADAGAGKSPPPAALEAGEAPEATQGAGPTEAPAARAADTPPDGTPPPSGQAASSLPETQSEAGAESPPGDEPPPPPPAPAGPGAGSPQAREAPADGDAGSTGDGTASSDTETAALPPPPPMLPEVRERALPPAPDPALVEPSPDGPLPRVGPDGRKPWQAYARPFDGRDDRPRVAIIVSGLGLSSAATEAAIQGLPSEVTLAFQPFADNIQQWIRLARAAGHEVLLNLPMEPVDYPESDPGPQALFVTLTPDENIERLRWALSRVSGYVGVLNHMGSRFTTSREAMVPVLDELKSRGLMFVDARASARSVATIMASERRVPRAINDRFLDAREVSRATVDARLEEVERIAEEAGVSVAVGQAFPVTIERIRAWAEGLDRKRVVLAPISAVVDRQGDR